MNPTGTMRKTALWTPISLVMAICIAAAAGQEMVPKPMRGMRKGMGMMSQPVGMADTTRQDCMAVGDTLEQVVKTLREARLSGNKAKMQKALENAEERLAETKGRTGKCVERMGRCMNMMKMMDGMGKGMMDKGAMNDVTADEKNNRKEPEDSSGHSNHHTE